MNQIELWVDGAAQPNPGRGGCAALLVENGQVVRRIVESYVYTTNNRMELKAVVLGLSALSNGATVTIYSDSGYVVRGIRAGRVGAKRYPVNRDLWDALLDYCDHHKVQAVHVTAHAGTKFNEQANRLAQEAAWDLNAMKYDDGYKP